MGEMIMPGGWTLSMMWMRMPGQTWPGAAAAFLGMWIVMMLPAFAAAAARLGRLTVVVAAGYFFVWAAIGLAVFPLGVALAALAMAHPAFARAVPVASSLVVVLASAFQFTAWKARHLACCREPFGRRRPLPADLGSAWRDGLRLGVHCVCTCAGLTTILLVIGVMDLGAMAVVTSAIMAERLAPASERVTRGIGIVGVGAGLVKLIFY